MGSSSSPPNQAAERGANVLTTSRSRRRGIQPITVADSAQPTRPITAFNFFQTVFFKVNLRKSHHPQELTSESFLRSLLVSSLHIQVTSTCRPAPASPAAVPAPANYQHLHTMRRRRSSQHQLQTSSSLTISARKSTNT